MTSATDIITYIGIPLAVLGVLPILYTFVLSILTQRRLRNLLISHGHRPQRSQSSRAQQDGFSLRASPMTSLIEVEMPRYTIAPVERGDERYWVVAGFGVGDGSEDKEREGEVDGLLTDQAGGGGRGGGDMHVQRAESTLSMLEQGRVRGFLRGGSWRAFHWKRLVVGRKMYRIQYEDELREPTAEIEFVDLVNFLMDWGAELDEVGWERLRSGGLWTPSGTVLLRVKERARSRDGGGSVRKDVGEVGGRGGRGGGSEWVLRTSVPDDSDGVLTLCIRWPQVQGAGSIRSPTSLPPGWGRLRRPHVARGDVQTDESQSKNVSAQIVAFEEDNKNLLETDGVRFKIDNGLISKVYHEFEGKETGLVSELFHLPGGTFGVEWFTSAAVAVLNVKETTSTTTNTNKSIIADNIDDENDTNGSLWGFSIPPQITNFLHKDSIPCGVLVLLSILPPSTAPHWTNSDRNHHDETMAQAHQHTRRFEARRQAERLEATMPPEQARVHRTNRQRDELRAQHEQAIASMNASKAREAQRLQDALVSPRVGFKTVAEACLKWLVENGHVDTETSLVSIVEAVLYLFVLESQSQSHDTIPQEKQQEEETKTTMTESIMTLLSEWNKWTQAGGMNREQYDLLATHTTEFCHAACLVALVHEIVPSLASGGKGKASVDMLECLRLWKRVRLG